MRLVLVVGGDLLGWRAERGAGSARTLQDLCSQLVQVVDDVGRREVSLSLVIG